MSLSGSASEFLIAVKHRLPMRLRAGPLYWDTVRLIREQEQWTEDRIVAWQMERLGEILRHCGKHVPYYRRLFRNLGFDPEQFRHLEDLRALPLLDKQTVLKNTEDFLAENIPASQRLYYTTGGTTGKPMNLYGPLAGGWRERAFMDMQWERAGYSPDQKKATLKGAAVKARDHVLYDPDQRAYRFSTYHLTPENAARYAQIMKDKRIAFLHGYISSALEFGRQLEQAKTEPPPFKAIFPGSENLYPGQREKLEDYFHCRIYTWYGHSENLILAGECEVSPHYHIFPQYGFAELISEDLSSQSREDQMGELVGTTLFNQVMPLLRYRTGDYGVVGPKSCACGRSHQLLSSIRGRWLQENLVGRFGNRISATALNMHSDIFDNVEQFQLHQREPGKAEMWIVRKPEYRQTYDQRIVDAFSEKMGDSVELVIKFVDAIPLTERGKFRYIVQEIPLAEDLELEKSRFD